MVCCCCEIAAMVGELKAMRNVNETLYRRLLFLYTFSLVVVAVSSEISLSPDEWPKEEFERLKNYTAQTFHTPKPLAVSRGGGVVSGATSSLAVHAGLVALRKEGNAMDACIATALTDIVLSAGSFISFAGVTEILYYKNDDERVYSLDGGWNIPSHMDSSKILPLHTHKPNGASVLVPGFMAGVAAAVKRFANFNLETLLEPALYFAKNGFKVPGLLATLFKLYFNDVTLLRTEEGKRLFTNPETGDYYKKGEIFKQPDLQMFLETMASEGVSDMYSGTWAKDMISLVQRENGFITLDDLRNYEVNWTNALNTSYRGYIAASSGAYDGSSGSVELMEKLNLMEVAGIGLGHDSYLTNSTELYWLASIIRFSDFISIYERVAPNALDILKNEFGFDFVLQNRISKDFARAVWHEMVRPGGMEDINKKIYKLVGGKVSGNRAAHSSAVVAMDKEGNVCSMIHTINSLPWGTGLFVQGIALAHAGAINKAHIKNAKPGSRLSSELQPSIVLRRVDENKQGNCERQEMKSDTEEGNEVQRLKNKYWEPAMALAVVGKSLHEVTPQHVTSLLDRVMNPEQALACPQFMLPSLHSHYQDVQVQRYTIDENVLCEVREKGQDVKEINDLTAIQSYGLGVALTVSREGTRYAASTPYLDGIAEGENI